MMRGEIYKKDGMYYLVVDESSDVNYLKDKVKALEDSEKRLKGELEKLSKKSEWFNADELYRYKKWLDEANVAYEELEKSTNRQLDEALERCFNHMTRYRCLPVLQAQTFNEFKKWALGMDTSDTDADFNY